MAETTEQTEPIEQIADTAQTTETQKEHVAPPEIDDEAVKAYLSKRGIKVDSIDDLVKPVSKTKEQLEKEEKDFNDDALSWGLKEGKIKREDYDKSVVLKNKSSLDIAFEAYFAEQKQDDAKISLETAKEMFDEEYHLTSDDDSWQKRNGLKRIEKIANDIKNELKKVDEIPNMYREELTVKEQRKALSKQIKSLAYEMPEKIEFKEGDITVEIPIDKDDISEVVKNWDSDFVFDSLFKKGKSQIDPKLLKEQIIKDLQKNIPTKKWIAAMKSYGDKRESELRTTLANSGFGRGVVQGQTTQSSKNVRSNEIEEATRMVMGKN